MNKNMPLRFLQYVSAEYEKLIISKDLHRRTLVKIPAPHFVVFYNGTERCAERQELRLSKAETDENTLRKWLKLAGSAESIETFRRGM